MLRIIGYQPWKTEDRLIQVEPGGKFYTAHPTLGYTHIPGEFTVTLPSGYQFEVTHLPNTRRITHPLSTYAEGEQKAEIWVFGGSFTHGWTLNDEETYPWLLQERFPDYEVVNFGVSGHGTIHSLIQFRAALEAKQPVVAVLAYAGFHDERNTYLRSRRKGAAYWRRLGPLIQPYARLNDDGSLRYAVADLDYCPFPLMEHLALAHVLELAYNKLEYHIYRSHAVSEAIVADMAELARVRGIQFIVAGISAEPGTDAMLSFARRQGIPAVDIAVDLSIEGNSNRPHDAHPSALANRKYAERLAAFLAPSLPAD